MISSGSSLYQTKILIVDSDPELRDLFALALQSEKREILAVENATKALNLLKQENFDLVLVDIFDGLEVVQRMRENRNYNRIVVLGSIISANNILKAVSCGVTSFIEKPVNLTLLRRVVEENLAEQDSSITRAFQQARHLNFGAASHILKESCETGTALIAWQKVFQALARGAKNEDLAPYGSELMECAMSR